MVNNYRDTLLLKLSDDEIIAFRIQQWEEMAYPFIGFEGDDQCKHYCMGWDGESNRCQCKKHLMFWTQSDCRRYVYPEGKR